MSFWKTLFGGKTTADPAQSAAQDLDAIFQAIAGISLGPTLKEVAGPSAGALVGLPQGEGTSLRLAPTRGIMTVMGEGPRVVSAPVEVASCCPTLYSLAGMARILLDLDYDGIEAEAPLIGRATAQGKYKIRISYSCEPTYPIIRMQLNVHGELDKPLNVEGLPDIRSINVQDFYSSLQKSGKYELSVHAHRRHLASVYGAMPRSVLDAMPKNMTQVVKHLKSIPEGKRSMPGAVRSFESKHPMGEGM